MAAKVYVFTFGSGDPRTYTGQSPTFILFFDNTGTNQTAPSISELKSGSGYYGFSYTISATQTIQFLVSGNTVGLLGSYNYIPGVIDPVMALDQQPIFGSSGGLGSLSDSFGSTSVDPTSVFGYLKRLQELWEGDSVFTASSGLWQMFNRASLGTTTLLRTKTLVNSGTSVTKTGL
jgi:hypothetical protein